MKKYEILENSNKVIEVEDSTMSQIEDDNDNENDNDNTGVGRTYECNYCKRGFTNAQALGGHMNIHRKEKAKFKKQQNNYSYFSSSPSFLCKNHNEGLLSSYNYNYNYNNYNNSNYNNPSFTPQIRSIYGANDFYKSSSFYPFSNPNYFSQNSIYYGNNNDFSSEKNNLLDMYEENLGVDLSLRMSSSSSTTMVNNHFNQGEEYKKDDKYGAIDLELRLGYDP
ncbi:hypothetical protein RND81_14G132500 [Saponaria officinalis]|uniref:C2H2-type domain-containing protein n=1 Tax=Saponaria officinalis TaxID=3572 RepID=A0AAW1GPW2_SAPOF